MATPEPCYREGCTKAARMAVRTRRPTRENVYITVWTDERAKGVPQPKLADRFCKEHGLDLLEQLLAVLVDMDEAP